MNVMNRRDFFSWRQRRAWPQAGKAKPLYAESQEVLGWYGHGE